MLVPIFLLASILMCPSLVLFLFSKSVPDLVGTTISKSSSNVCPYSPKGNRSLPWHNSLCLLSSHFFEVRVRRCIPLRVHSTLVSWSLLVSPIFPRSRVL